MSAFQVKLSGDWQDQGEEEDAILRRAYLAGFPKTRYTLRGSRYEVDFASMRQKNLDTEKVREIRPPCTLADSPAAKAGRTVAITVPDGSPGKTVEVPNPEEKGKFVSVRVPASAKVGQKMLVPLAAEVPTAGRGHRRASATAASHHHHHSSALAASDRHADGSFWI